MPVPDFQTLMLPVLRRFEDGAEHGLREATDAIAREFQLTAADIAEALPSGAADAVPKPAGLGS